MPVDRDSDPPLTAGGGRGRLTVPVTVPISKLFMSTL